MLKQIIVALAFLGFAASVLNLRPGVGTNLVTKRFRGSPVRSMRPDERFSLNVPYWRLYIQNDGTETATSVSIGFYISLDATVTTADRLLQGGREHETIPPGGNVLTSQNGAWVSTTWPNVNLIPQYCGWKYLGAVIDEWNSVAETNENDNVNRYLTYIYCQPDLYAASISLPDGNVVTPDIWFNINAEIGNGGYGTAAIFRVGFYISTNAIIDPAEDRLLSGGVYTARDLLQDETRSWTQRVAVNSNFNPPITAYCDNGFAYIGYIVDSLDQVDEDVWERNNYIVTRVTLDCRPNLQVAALNIPKTNFVIDEAFGPGFRATITNRGMTLGGISSTNPGFRLSWYISDDEEITRNDRRIRSSSQEFSTLMVSNRLYGLALAENAKISSVSPNRAYEYWCGDVWLGALVDDTRKVAESNETDNFWVGPLIGGLPVQIHVDCGDCEEDDECLLPHAPSCVRAHPNTGPAHCGCSDASDCPELLDACVATHCAECSQHSDCADSGRNFCKDNQCIECISNGHCPQNTFCDLGECVECKRDSHCEGEQKCHPDTRTCVPQCWNNDHCETGDFCNCDGYCVDCLRDGHCPPTEQCVNSVCEFSCSSNTDCVAFRPGTVCDPITSKCVECHKDDKSLCTMDPIRKRCDVPSRSCVECKKDVHCAGGVCQDGACVPN